MSDTETQKQKEYITLDGKIIEAKRASIKAPFSIVMINDADIKKYVLNAWKTLADELEVLQIEPHDEIHAEVYDYKGVNEYKTTFYGSEVLQYNLHSSENILAINNNIILEMNPNQLQDNIKQITAEDQYLEDEINRNAEEEAKKVVNSLPIKNNLTREEQNILDAKPIEKTKKPVDKDLITIQKKQQGTPKQLNKSIVDKNVMKKGDFYIVAGGKKIPNAQKIQEEINNLIEKTNRVLNCYIIECDKNEEKAWAKVQVEDQITHQKIEAMVIHHYKTLIDDFLLDLFNAFDRKKTNERGELICPNNPIADYDTTTMKPILTAEAQKSIIIRLLKFKQFAERDAATKAASIAYLKMLSREWRTAEEIESEIFEVEMVNSK